MQATNKRRSPSHVTDAQVNVTSTLSSRPERSAVEGPAVRPSQTHLHEGVSRIRG